MSGSAAAATVRAFVPLALPGVGYAYDALEPHIDKETMMIHHSKHHNAYTTKTNMVLEALNKDTTLPADLRECRDVQTLLDRMEEIPKNLRGMLRNNGGGYLNHIDYWASMSPNGGGVPPEPLKGAILSTFGSMEQFQTDFTQAALNQFGSGWVWLMAEKSTGKLSLQTTPNQDRPDFAGGSLSIILACDVWEHAYYLKFQNFRDKYMSEFFLVADYENANKRYEQVKSSKI